MALLLQTDGSTQTISPPPPQASFEREDLETLLGGPVLAVDSNDGHLLILRIYKVDDPEWGVPNPQAERYFSVWPVVGPAVHCKYHEWYESLEAGSPERFAH